MTEDGKQKRLLFLLSTALIVSTVIAYEPIRNNSFVNFDDDQYITDNPNVKSGLTVKSVEWAFAPYASNWHPLTWLSHIIDYQLFGPNPIDHHLVNVLFHIANALLLFWILIKITNSTWASAFAAAVFALHPLQVESVAWAAERKTVLSVFFCFLTIAIYIWYVRKPGIWKYILLFGTYALAVMAKPVVVTLPFVLLLLDYWPLGRFDGLKPILQKKQLILEKVPLLVLVAVLCVITIISQHQGGAIIALEKVPLKFRIANALISYMAYIGKLFWPSSLAVFYPFPVGPFPMVKAVICGIALILITGTIFYAGQFKKYLLTGWLWYAGTMVPMAGLVQAGSQTMADRYMYLPMIGLLFIVTWLIKETIVNKPALKIATATIASIILITFIMMTRTQVRYWQNSKSLFEHTLNVTQNNAPAEFNYGCALTAEGNYKEAIEHLDRALKLCPSSTDALKGLGIALLRDEKTDEAIKCFKEIQKRGKNSADINYYLAVASGLQKKFDDAIQYLTAAIKLDPKYPDAHNKMGEALLETGKVNEAIDNLNEELKISGDDADIYVNLGRAYSKKGRNDQVVQNWTKALQLKPDRVDILNNLAWLIATDVYITREDVENAVKYAERACKLTGYKEANTLDTLGASYAAAERFDEAIKAANDALKIARDSNQTEPAKEIQERIKMYQSRRRYSEENKK